MANISQRCSIFSFLGARQGVFGPFGLVLITDPPGAGHAFPRQRHMRRGSGLFISARVFSLYDAIHGWMMGRMMGQIKKLHEKRPRRPLLYVMPCSMRVLPYIKNGQNFILFYNFLPVMPEIYLPGVTRKKKKRKR